jgi:hypothetical protein
MSLGQMRLGEAKRRLASLSWGFSPVGNAPLIMSRGRSDASSFRPACSMALGPPLLIPGRPAFLARACFMLKRHESSGTLHVASFVKLCGHNMKNLTAQRLSWTSNKGDQGT